MKSTPNSVLRYPKPSGAAAEQDLLLRSASFRTSGVVAEHAIYSLPEAEQQRSSHPLCATRPALPPYGSAWRVAHADHRASRRNEPHPQDTPRRPAEPGIAREGKGRAGKGWEGLDCPRQPIMRVDIQCRAFAGSTPGPSPDRQREAASAFSCLAATRGHRTAKRIHGAPTGFASLPA
jgi:hypothetical protein